MLLLQVETPGTVEAATDLSQAAAESGQASMADQLDSVTQAAGFQELAPPIQIALFLGGMVLLSGGLVSLTAFTRIVIVLSFVRRALATQEIPPNTVIIGLSMFLTMFVMGPTLSKIHDEVISPLMAEQMSTEDAWTKTSSHLRAFMLAQTHTDTLEMFIDVSGDPNPETMEDTPMRVLIPSFVVSELKTAFIMGFCIYIPFLLIDLVVSTVLMSLGMMMMPPMIVSTPCKLILFILVDGWSLIVYSLSQSFNAPLF